jgi:SAM-dependent methyltransferase
MKFEINRRLNWLPSNDVENFSRIKELEDKLAAFYQNNPDYYNEIDFTNDNWVDKDEIGYQQIVTYAHESPSICEFGCGSANLLKHYPELCNRYSGCDFSKKLIQQNRKKYPAATFNIINAPNELPFEDEKYDLVFSVFVLEHCTFPSKVLDECFRILKPDGRLVILCPNFLAKGRMSSQRAGWSEGTTTEKLRKGRFLDAVITLFDNRIRIPLLCILKKLLAKKQPRFLINVNPTVFVDRFNPDVDAVYVTYKNEIVQYLQNKFKIESNNGTVELYEKSKNLIFLSLRKMVSL